MEQNRRWKVNVWGTRGSFPMAAAEYLEFGGNTSCISVDCGGELIVFDAGSGIAGLGRALARRSEGRRVHIFLSHLHLDHILGLTGFSPLHDPAMDIHLYGEARGPLSFQSQLERIIGPPYWPIGLRDFRAKLTLHETGPGARLPLAGGLWVDVLRGNHPGQSLIYRLEGRGKRVVYTPDCELAGDMAPRLTEFSQSCDLLVWDASFAPADLRRGWGHSTWEQGAALGRAAGAKLVLMTHYSGQYTDQFLREQERLFQGDAVRFAREGMEIVL